MGFGFDFDSFVRGEAKLRVRVRRVSWSLGLPVASCPPCSGFLSEGFRTTVAAIHVSLNSIYMLR